MAAACRQTRPGHDLLLAGGVQKVPVHLRWRHAMAAAVSALQADCRLQRGARRQALVLAWAMSLDKPRPDRCL